MVTERVRGRKLADIPLDRIDPDSFVLRGEQGDVSELRESVKLLELLEPLVVRRNPTGSKYLLLAGHRRYRALLSLGARKAKVVIDSESE
ncbi:MAG: ParB N-terminal domain-containing protein [Conexivisphaerales archaeon]